MSLLNEARHSGRSGRPRGSIARLWIRDLEHRVRISADDWMIVIVVVHVNTQN